MAAVLFTEVLKLVPLYEQARSNDDIDRSDLLFVFVVQCNCRSV